MKDEESNKWLKLLENIGKIGVENTHLLNSQSGEIISDNNTFLLDEELLKQIKIIDRYSIQENGQPAVRIIGNIPELARVIKKSTVLYEEDLYREFLNNKHDYRAEELLRFACQKNTSSYPFYFLFIRMNLNQEESKSFLETTKITGTTRKSYIQRIEKDHKQIKSKNKFSLSNKTPNGAPRLLFLNNFQNNIEFQIGDLENVKRILESIFSLESGQYEIEFVKKKIFEIFETYFPFDKTVNNYLFRDAVTYLDFLEK